VLSGTGNNFTISTPTDNGYRRRTAPGGQGQALRLQCCHGGVAVEMTTVKDEARAKAAATYNAASDRFDEPALSFWDRFGRETVERLALQPGAHFLDGPSILRIEGR